MNKKISRIHYQTFKSGSRTYFNSSLFFPSQLRRDVFILYGFVRVADNYVDSIPADRQGFHRFKELYERAWRGNSAGDPIVDPFIELSHRKSFEAEWVAAFLHSMEMDLTKKDYDHLEDTLEYIYGSAEVIGLFMARIMDLSEESHHPARMLGRAMQYINFIRDIDEDRQLGRRYLPLQGTGLSALDKDTALRERESFIAFIRHHLDLYRGWQKEAEMGFPLIPRRYRIPIKTASDMYNWTARGIESDPFVVFEKKVKPPRIRILLQVLGNLLKA
jgi:phytoene synthase